MGGDEQAGLAQQGPSHPKWASPLTQGTKAAIGWPEHVPRTPPHMNLPRAWPVWVGGWVGGRG